MSCQRRNVSSMSCGVPTHKACTLFPYSSQIVPLTPSHSAPLKMRLTTLTTDTLSPLTLTPSHSDTDTLSLSLTPTPSDTDTLSLCTSQNEAHRVTHTRVGRMPCPWSRPSGGDVSDMPSMQARACVTYMMHGHRHELALHLQKSGIGKHEVGNTKLW